MPVPDTGSADTPSRTVDGAAPTNFAIEQAEQRRWTLRPRFAGAAWFESLVANEFLSLDEQFDRQERALSQIVRFAAAEVPYYRETFRRLGLGTGDVRTAGELERLPVIDKRAIQEAGHDAGRGLKARSLPKGERYAGPSVSSGSTGPPTRVFQTRRSLGMWGLLLQRGRRWFRFDPAGTFAEIRNRENLPRGPDRRPIADGVTARAPSWPQMGRYFKTGPFIGFAKTTPLDQIADWLEEQRPDYLLSDSAVLEHLALEFQERSPLDGLGALLAISEPLTPGMATRIGQTFCAPICRAYGMNEVGMMATRCPEGQRYHVHSEHCLLEIVDAEGKPCRPGDYGRVLVTVLTNMAMPLIRYDTGDMAQALDGPCPCGRTLPAIGEVLGRYTHIAPVAASVRGPVNALRGALESLPPELSAKLRKYQVHHRRNGDFELRLVVTGTPPAAFAEHLQQVWRAATRAPAPALHILEVDHIRLAPSGKFFYFTSETVPSSLPETKPARVRPGRSPAGSS